MLLGRVYCRAMPRLPYIALVSACFMGGGLLGGGVLGCGSDTTAGGFEQLSGSGGATVSSSSTASSASGQTSSAAAGGGGAQKLGPPYPIVLSHGFFGFEDFAGAGFISYYYGVRDHLAENGETLVFTPAVDPFNDSTTRGAQLAAKIEAILAETGHEKVNIIGHSQGGLDARVVAHDYPDMVASVVTLQTPHGGSPVADIALEIVSDPLLRDLLDLLVQIVGQPLYDEVGAETSLADALREFSKDGVAALNAKYTDQPGIYYASVAGRSDLHDGGGDCAVADAPDFIADWGGERDPIDPLLDISETLLDGGLNDPYPNDGLVRVRDAKWGRFLGCVPADHLDQIGQLFGDGPGIGNHWDYLQFYVALVQHLRERGL